MFNTTLRFKESKDKSYCWIKYLRILMYFITTMTRFMIQKYNVVMCNIVLWFRPDELNYQILESIYHAMKTLGTKPRFLTIKSLLDLRYYVKIMNLM